MIAGTLLFLSGLPRYRIHVIRKVNPLIEIIQVYVVAFRNRNLKISEDPEELYEINRDIWKLNEKQSSDPIEIFTKLFGILMVLMMQAYGDLLMEIQPREIDGWG